MGVFQQVRGTVALLAILLFAALGTYMTSGMVRKVSWFIAAIVAVIAALNEFRD